MNIQMEAIEKKFNDMYDKFSNENIGNSKLKMMPPINDKPRIERISYDKNTDVFEIAFKLEDPNNIIKKNRNNVFFIENKNGELLAMQIIGFSKMNVERIKVTITTSIENEIKSVALEIKAKKNIANNISEKRKLQFINELIKTSYKEISKKSMNLTTD
jgi:hypothetical protein